MWSLRHVQLFHSWLLLKGSIIAKIVAVYFRFNTLSPNTHGMLIVPIYVNYL